MGRVEGKVALVTGAARGQGRSHAVRLAEEGADVIAIDICAEIPDMPYPPTGPADLAETARLVEEQDRRVVAAEADIRDFEALSAAIAAGVEELGRLDIVAANAGITGFAKPGIEISEESWRLHLDINLTGAWHTMKAGIPHLLAGGRGGAVIATTSTAALRGYRGIAHYTAAKHGLTGLVRTLSQEYGSERIRVNCIAPSTVDTPMAVNDEVKRIFLPGVEEPTMAEFEAAATTIHPLPTPWLEPIDISNALLFLASDEARYITGITLPVDAGLSQH